MNDDIRYCEFCFLNAIRKGEIDVFNSVDKNQMEAVGLSGEMYVEMASALVEDLYICFHNRETQKLVSRLRGEMLEEHRPANIADHVWANPRQAVHDALAGHSHGGLQTLRITYRGLRRIEELRDILRHDRILEPFGVLLSMQYFRKDAEDALKQSVDVPISVLYADMDNFKRINTEFGQSAGDVVMKAYLEAVRDGLGLFGSGFRGVGDEVACLVIGQGHKKAVELGEAIRKRVESIRCKYKGKQLPNVTASIGVATTPPELRAIDIETIAEDRKRAAKERGKNQVIAD